MKRIYALLNDTPRLQKNASIGGSTDKVVTHLATDQLQLSKRNQLLEVSFANNAKRLTGGDKAFGLSMLRRLVVPG